MTAYFHFMFTTLDLSVIRDAPNANVTAIQVFEPDNKLANNLLAEYNFKNMINHKETLKYLPVRCEPGLFASVLPNSMSFSRATPRSFTTLSRSCRAPSRS